MTVDTNAWKYAKKRSFCNAFIEGNKRCQKLPIAGGFCHDHYEWDTINWEEDLK